MILLYSSDGDETPIHLLKQREDLKRILLRALNKNQILILKEVSKNSKLTISSLLLRMEKEFKVPLSTLKLNARILKKLNLINFGNSSPARLTELGEFIMQIIGGESNDW